MYPTVEQLKTIAGRRAKVGIVNEVAKELPILASKFGLDKPHRLAQFIPQIAHESAGFSTTKEFASGKAYEGRRDLGNTRAGDGVKFKGHGLIQCTGRANHREFTKWLRARIKDAPDFEADPDKLMEFPYALLSAFWFWDTRKLNAYADEGNIEMITKRINGGRNGLADRIDLYERTALTMLGFGTDEPGIRAFQKRSGIKQDGIAGPKTRAALHEALKAEQVELPEVIKPAPKPEPTPIPKTEPVKARWGGFIGIAGLVAAFAILGLFIWFTQLMN